MSQLRGGLAIVFMATNTVFWALVTYVMGLVRVLLPRESWRLRWAGVMNFIIDGWVSCNRWMYSLLLPTQIEVRGAEQLRRGEWYLLLSNHQSWTDILVLQTVMRDRVPPLKFFTKMQLIWLPFLGLAMWALDFPFMRRYSKSYLAKHPEMRGRDLETTREKCERFRPTPTSIIIFVEGTRNTPEKHAQQQSPHTHLLKPRAGGAGFVLSAMGDQLNGLIDCTLVYPDGRPNFWAFLCGRTPRVIVDVAAETLPRELTGGDYERDDAYRLLIQEWVTERWLRKDALIDAIRRDADAGRADAGRPDPGSPDPGSPDPTPPHNAGVS